MSRPPDELEGITEKLASELDLTESAKSFASLILPAIANMRRAEAGHEARLAMLQAAIALVQGNKAVLTRTDLQDPFGSGPFEYTQQGDGFQLRSQLIGQDGKPVSLTVGRARTN